MNNALYRVFTISKTFVDRTKDGALYLLKEYFYNKYILQTTKNNYYNFKQTSYNSRTIIKPRHADSKNAIKKKWKTFI